MSQSFDAFGAFSKVMKKSSVPPEAPDAAATQERRGPGVAADRVVLDTPPDEPPLQIDPEVRRILDETKAVAEVGDAPKTTGPVAKESFAGGFQRPWQRIKTAAKVLLLTGVMAGVAVGPVLNAPYGMERAQTAIEQTYQETVHDVQFEPDERESLRELWVEGFERWYYDANQTPIPDNFMDPEPGIEVSFEEGFPALLEHIEQTKVAPEVRGYNGAGGDAFEVRWKNSDGHVVFMEIPSERMADGRYASQVLFDHLNETGAQYTGAAVTQSGGPLDGAVVAPLAGDSKFVHLYNNLAHTGGLEVETANGSTVTVTPDDGALKIKTELKNGRTINRTLTEANFALYEGQMLDLVQQHQAQAVYTPGLTRR